jgi:hypothetical protein
LVKLNPPFQTARSEMEDKSFDISVKDGLFG